MTFARDLANFADVSANNLTFRNLVINGAMNVWQRNTSFTVGATAYTYTSDRWKAYSGNTSTTVSRDTSVPSGFIYSLKLQRPNGNTGTNSLNILQVVETINMIPLQNQTVVLSFYAKKGANYSGGNMNIQLLSGTASDQGGDPYTWTGLATPINTTTALTTSWTRYNFTGTVGSTVQELAIALSYTPSGTAGADDAIYITGVQLERGSSASTYEFKPYDVELAQCQRYYQLLEIPTESLGAQYSSPSSGSFFSEPIHFLTSMRTSPSTVTYTNVSAGNYWVIVGNTAVSAASLTGQTFTTTPNALKIAHTRQAGGATPTVGNYYVWEAAFKLGVSAEL